MTHLRQIMIEELRRRNFADSTVRSYLHAVEHFSRYFHRRPDQLGPEHIRQYQAALFTKLKFSPNTVTLRLAALRFFYIQVLKRGWSIAETPYPKKVFHLPEILSQEQVARLIDAAEFPFHRILLMTLYATGARREEVAHLKLSDIDSQRMVVHIRGGKGRKDRDVMLSPKLLWRDSAHSNRKRVMTLSVGEFLRRFLLHLLPRGFVRIRNFGFLANRRRAELLPLCFRLLKQSDQHPARPALPSALSTHSLWNCPLCGGIMHIVERLSAAQLLLRSPPHPGRCAA